MPISLIRPEHRHIYSEVMQQQEKAAEFSKPDADNKIHIRKYLTIFNLSHMN